MISGNKKLTVLHLTPWREVCGIADYAADMIDALSSHGVVNHVYPMKKEFSHYTSSSWKAFYTKVSSADLIHIQHDFSFFNENLKYSIENFHQLLKKLNQFKKPVVVSFHTDVHFFDANIYQFAQNGNFVKTLSHCILKQYWKNKIAGFFKKHSNFQAIVHTKQTRLRLMDSGFSPEAIHVIPLGISPRNALISMDKDLAKEKLNYPKDITLLSIFGFMTENKGHEFAIKALKLLPKNYHLAIVGGPYPKEKTLIADEILQGVYEDPTIKDRIRITGYVDENTRDLYHAATNICLAPYYGNASGSAGIGWALSSGNPIIASRTSTFSEINQEADCFLMCAQKSVFELAWLIEYLIADSHLQAKLVKNALTYAADNQWSNVARDIINCYQKCLGHMMSCPITLPNGVRYRMMIEADFHDPISQECRKGKAYQENAVELMLRLVHADSKILDIGAHIGTFSLAAAANGCQVLAIEASPFHAQLIKSSAKSNQFDKLKIINAAVSDRDGFLEFSPDGPWGNVAIPEDNLSPEKMTKVRALPVRDLLKEVEWGTVDFIKMDVEGYEVAALNGMSELLASSKAPPIFFESNIPQLERYGQTPEKLKTFLENVGYKLYVFVGGRLAPVKADDFQAFPCVDYLAIKEFSESLARYIRPPLYQKEVIQTVLDMCVHPLASQRLVLAKALKQADEWIVDHAKVKKALDRLKLDVDPEVREHAAWWNSQIA